MAKQQGTNVYVYSDWWFYVVLPMSMVNMGKLSSLNEHN